MQTIGDRIKEERIKKNYSQEILADKVGVSRVAVTKWESGQTFNLKLINLMKLCKLLDISVDYLIFGGTRQPYEKQHAAEIKDDEYKLDLSPFSCEEVQLLADVADDIKSIGKNDFPAYKTGVEAISNAVKVGRKAKKGKSGKEPESK